MKRNIWKEESLVFRFALRSRPKAFVLVQLIASIALFAIIMVGISSMMGETSRLTRKLTERQESVTAAQIVLARLQRELSQAFHELSPRAQTLFIARPSREGTELIFSYLDSPLKPLFENRTPGIRMAAYSLERDRNTALKKLMRSEVPWYRSEEIELATPAVMATGIISWDFEFYDLQRDRWVPAWDSIGQEFDGDFPYAIRIRLEVVDPAIEDETQIAQKSLVYQTAFRVFNQYRE